MKIQRIDAHDRFTFFKQQDSQIAECCQSLINERPFGEHPFYIFAHARTIGMDERIKLFMEDVNRSLLDPTYVRKYKSIEDVPEKTIIWQPRLTKPKAQTNSMLFKGYPGTDNVKIIWIIPPKELWQQFNKGNMTESETIYQSIHDFQNNRGKLEEREDDDLSDAAIARIYEEISRDAKRKNDKSKQT